MKTNLLSPGNIKHIAQLARLGLTKEENFKLQKQLSSILDFVSKLNKLDTKDVVPTSQVTGLENVFHEDEVRPSLSQEEVLKNAPRKHKGYFVVDAIFEK